jgi:hypothetical protein
MTITITHCRASIDPAGTISDAAWPEFLEKFEAAITDSIQTAWPEAEVRFQHAETAGNGIVVSDDPSGDIAFETAWEIDRLWEAALA